jgi:release factor glutamine methyltransferase
MPEALTLNQAFVAAATALRGAGNETPELDARLLLCHAAGVTHEAYIARASDALLPEAAACLEQALARRLKHEPVSRIIGIREFYGRAFGVGPEALDPRPDTETLIETALSIADERGGRNQPLSLLDLGTGTGCILVTLLAELPAARGVGTDISEAALALAAANAAQLDVAQHAAFVAADWLDGIAGRFDLILSNPPYLTSAEIGGLAADVSAYEPHRALDGGPDGLAAYRRIAARAPDLLAEAGRLIVEIGAGQADAVAKIFVRAGLEIVRLCHDIACRPRVIVAGA